MMNGQTNHTLVPLIARPDTTATATATATAAATATVQPAPATKRNNYVAHSLGPSLNTLIRQSRVLVVGAGGIGCELLKNLVLVGFGEIHIVDLDTIDLSNLNRQFLFRKEHIKKPKALVAKETAQHFNPSVNIIAHHANIKDSGFNMEWFEGFKLVFNALDNVDARRHVNKMCLAADVPLVESGTTGFNGQVQVIRKGVTACYDCAPKETPRSYPVCTIRSTPSQPIHCIVWAKSYLLAEVFGVSEDDPALDGASNQENAKEIEELKREAGALRAIRQSMGTPDFAQMLFEKVFSTDIFRLKSMEDMWKSKKPPEPLNFQALMGSATAVRADSVLREGQRVWTLEEDLAVFNDSLLRLSKRLLDMKQTRPDAIISFDKDDDDTLDFVAAAANIRSYVFGIAAKSKFDIKQMAGNIIPAIATTNAIVAGLCVLEAFKVLRAEYEQAREVFLQPFASARLLASDKPRDPSPSCPVCSEFQTRICVDLTRATLGDLVEDFLRLELGYGEKEISVSTEVGLVYDPEETDNLSRKLSDLGIKLDSVVTVKDDDDDNPFVNVVLHIREAKEPLDEKPIKGLAVKKQIPFKPKELPIPETNGHGKDAGPSTAAGKDTLGSQELKSAKRQRPDDLEELSAPKKARMATRADDDALVVIDDAATATTNGAFIIDD